MHAAGPRPLADSEQCQTGLQSQDNAPARDPLCMSDEYGSSTHMKCVGEKPLAGELLWIRVFGCHEDKSSLMAMTSTHMFGKCATA